MIFEYVITQKKVRFFNRTVFLSSTWSWNFGDGNTSTLKEPSHTYAEYGEYLVTLTATCGSTTSTITKTVILDPGFSVPRCKLIDGQFRTESEPAWQTYPSYVETAIASLSVDSLTFTDIRFKLRVTNLIEGYSYATTILFYRRLIGETEWDYYASQIVPYTATGDSYESDLVYVPNLDPGYETSAYGCTSIVNNSGAAKTLDCEERGGTASLCGFSEFTNASVPPKKYLVNTMEQDFYWCTYGNSSCNGNAARFRLRIQPASATYESTTCAFTGAPYESWPQDVASCGPPATTPGFGTPRSTLVYDPAFMTLDELTSTRRVLGDRFCYNFSGGSYVTSVGSGEEELSVEDTEDNAIYREVTNTPIDWSTADCSSVLTFATTRGAGEFDFDFNQARSRAAMTGLTVGRKFKLVFQFYSQLIGSSGSDPWYLSESINIEFTSVSAGETSSWITFPYKIGYNTKLGECILILE